MKGVSFTARDKQHGLIERDGGRLWQLAALLRTRHLRIQLARDGNCSVLLLRRPLLQHCEGSHHPTNNGGEQLGNGRYPQWDRQHVGSSRAPHAVTPDGRKELT
jgi:hypothetical protein